MPQFKTYIAHITWWDILRGQMGKAYYCPVSRAIKRATKAERVCVTGHLASADGREIKLPGFISPWIVSFDHSRWNVRPVSFDFVMEVPDV